MIGNSSFLTEKHNNNRHGGDCSGTAQDAKHGFRFGSGLYFAEDLSKSLSYAARSPLEISAWVAWDGKTIIFYQ